SRAGGRARPRPLARPRHRPAPHLHHRLHRPRSARERGRPPPRPGPAPLLRRRSPLDPPRGSLRPGPLRPGDHPRPGHPAPRRERSAPEAGAPPRRHAVARVTAFMAKVRHGLLASREPKTLAASFGVSVVAWTLEVNVTALSMRAVGLDLPLSAIFLVLVAVN